MKSHGKTEREAQIYTQAHKNEFQTSISNTRISTHKTTGKICYNVYHTKATHKMEILHDFSPLERPA